MTTLLLLIISETHNLSSAAHRVLTHLSLFCIGLSKKRWITMRHVCATKEEF
jgi:hypothetical protein